MPWDLIGTGKDGHELRGVCGGYSWSKSRPFRFDSAKRSRNTTKRVRVIINSQCSNTDGLMSSLTTINYISIQLISLVELSLPFSEFKLSIVPQGFSTFCLHNISRSTTRIAVEGKDTARCHCITKGSRHHSPLCCGLWINNTLAQGSAQKTNLADHHQCLDPEIIVL